MVISAIYADIDFLCGSTSASYPTGSKLRNITIAANDVARVIWESSGGWQFDDSNQTDLPIATTDLVANQQDYALPTTALRVHGVSVLDSSSDYQKLQQVDTHDTTQDMSEFQETAGLPLYYDLIGNSIMLYPKPGTGYVTLTNGLKIYVERSINENNMSAVADSPGFPVPFHRILSYAAALDFVQDEGQRKFLAQQKARLEAGLTRFYSNRNVERRASFRPAGKRVWRQYL